MFIKEWVGYPDRVICRSFLLKSAYFVAFSAICTSGLFGHFLWVFLVASSYAGSAWSLPTSFRFCRSLLMQIMGYSTSGCALCLPGSVFLLAFPGQFYGHSVHFPLLGFYIPHSICESHTCYKQASLWMIYAFGSQWIWNSFFFSYLPCCFCIIYKKRGNLLYLSCHVQTGSLEIKFYSTFYFVLLNLLQLEGVF